MELTWRFPEIEFRIRDAAIGNFDSVGFGSPAFEFRDPFPVDLKNIRPRVKREFTRTILYVSREDAICLRQTSSADCYTYPDFGRLADRTQRSRFNRRGVKNPRVGFPATRPKTFDEGFKTTR